MTTCFKPAWWLNNAHLQTIYPTLFRKVKTLPAIRRERLLTSDEDFIDLDWCGSGNAPLVLLLHGLTGSSRSSYIQGLQCAIAQLGWRSVALNFRGCSGEYNLTSRCYHSGETADLQQIYAELRRREPNTPFAAVGFSLGGNMLLKWLGEQAGKVQLFGAVAVSVPLLLNVCATKLDSGFSKVYSLYLLRLLKRYVHDKRRHLQRLNKPEEAAQLAALGDLRGVTSFWQYDNQVIAKLYGFKDVHDYYQRSSSRQFLAAIKTPTLLIQAIDDPFMTQAVLPNSTELSAFVVLELTNAGGHVGFVSGHKPWRPIFWLDERIPAYLRSQYVSYSSVHDKKITH